MGARKPGSKSIFPFLKLPLELRELIYEHLIPNTELTITEADLIEPDQLRQDGTVCCPAILRTCRQVYDELIEPFYGSATFAIFVEQHEISFLGTPSYVYSPKFPRNLHHVRKLHIEMQLPPLTTVLTSKSYVCMDQLVEYINKYCTKLHKINIAFDICFLENLPRNRMEYYAQDSQVFMLQIVRPVFNWSLKAFKNLQRVQLVAWSGLAWPRRVQGDPTIAVGRNVQEILAEEAEIYCRGLVPEIFVTRERQSDPAVAGQFPYY